eukprot:scaffold131786_cov15-Tisochrysis_lutea.AAC.1
MQLCEEAWCACSGAQAILSLFPRSRALPRSSSRSSSPSPSSVLMTTKLRFWAWIMDSGLFYFGWKLDLSNWGGLGT